MNRPEMGNFASEQHRVYPPPDCIEILERELPVCWTLLDVV